MSTEVVQELSPEELEAQSQHPQTGPRTLAGKFNSSRNAFKHGKYARKHPSLIRSLYASMVGLGEDPEEFSRLQAGLINSFHPVTPAETLLVENLANLHWRRQRLERAQDAIVAHRIENLETARQRKSVEASNQMDEAVDAWQLARGLFTDEITPRRLRKAIELLEGLTERLKARHFSDVEKVLEWIYGAVRHGRARTITDIFRELASAGADAPADPMKIAELQRQLQLEVSRAVQLYDIYMRENVEISPTMRDACLATKEDQKWILREMSLVDSGIAQKTTLLLKMQESRRERKRAIAEIRVARSRKSGRAGGSENAQEIKN
jgi:hypothetical protein